MSLYPVLKDIPTSNQYSRFFEFFIYSHFSHIFVNRRKCCFEHFVYVIWLIVVGVDLYQSIYVRMLVLSVINIRSFNSTDIVICYYRLYALVCIYVLIRTADSSLTAPTFHRFIFRIYFEIFSFFIRFYH